MITEYDDVEALEAAAAHEDDEPEQKINPLEQILDGDDVPEDLRGKTVKDFLTRHVATTQTAQMLSQQLQQMMAQRADPAPKPEPEPVKFTDKELGYGADASEFEQKLLRMMEEKNAPLIHSYLQNAAQTTAMLAERDPQMPYFNRFRNQIYGLMQRARPDEQGQIATWRLAYNTVVAQNIDSLADEIVAKRRNNDIPPTETNVRGRIPGGGDSTKRGLKGSDLSADEKWIADKLGLDYDYYAKMKEVQNG